MSFQQRFKTTKITASTTTEGQGRRLLTPKESVLYTGVSLDAIYELIRDRGIPYIIRPGTGKRPKYWIDRLDWDRWIEERKVPVAA